MKLIKWAGVITITTAVTWLFFYSAKNNERIYLDKIPSEFHGDFFSITHEEDESPYRLTIESNLIKVYDKSLNLNTLGKQEPLYTDSILNVLYFPNKSIKEYILYDTRTESEKYSILWQNDTLYFAEFYINEIGARQYIEENLYSKFEL